MTIKYLICLVLIFGTGIDTRGDVFVNGDTGSDAYDGTVETLSIGPHGPVATLHRAVQLFKAGDRIVLHKTAKPYHESLVLVGVYGTPSRPVIIEGNGAVLEGLTTTTPDQWKDEGNGLISMKWGPSWGFNVVADGKFAQKIPSIEGLKLSQSYLVEFQFWNGGFNTSFDGIKPGQSSGDWKNSGELKHHGYYRLAPGQSLGKTRLDVSTGFCGVSIDDSSNVVVRNLVCQYFWDDGFNIQGNSQNIRLENIVGRWNGDQGVSAHGTADITVLGADLYGNDSGIVDTVVSRTRYTGVNVHNNVSVGVWFEGGDHSIIDSQIVDNPTGIFLDEAQGGSILPGMENDPDDDCRLAIRNGLIRGGAFGVQLSLRSRISIDHATIMDQPIGISFLGEAGFAYISNSVIAASKKSMDGPGIYWGDYNCWANSAATMKSGAVRLSDWGPAHGADKHSVFQSPDLSNAGELNPGSPATGKALVDDEYYNSLRHESMSTDAHPPRINRNMGYDSSAVAKSIGQ